MFTLLLNPQKGQIIRKHLRRGSNDEIRCDLKRKHGDTSNEAPGH